MTIVIHIIIVAMCLALWHFTQKLLAKRNVLVDGPDGAALTDGVHLLTARQNRTLLENPKIAGALLVASSLVTYGTSCDLFFSGHIAIAIYGAVTLASALGPFGIAVGCAIAIFEILTVLILLSVQQFSPA